MKTKIERIARNRVRLEGIDPFTQEPIRKEFWVSAQSGQTRNVFDETNHEVLIGFAGTGYVLTSTPEGLLDAIREQWKSYRAAARKLAQAA